MFTYKIENNIIEFTRETSEFNKNKTKAILLM